MERGLEFDVVILQVLFMGGELEDFGAHRLEIDS